MSSDAAKLVRAAAKGDDAKVKRLLKAKADVMSTAGAGITALQEACAKAWRPATRARDRRARSSAPPTRAAASTTRAFKAT